MATDQGGDRKSLPRPMLAAYVFCRVIPNGEAFGHSCRHPVRSTEGHGHSIKVLIRRKDNDPLVYAGLLAETSKAKLRKKYRVGIR